MERSSARIACCSKLRENTQRVLKRLVMLAKDDEEGLIYSTVTTVHRQHSYCVHIVCHTMP